MQALRLTRTAALRPALVAQRRCLATATANHVDVSASAQSSTRVAPIPLSNVEAHWERLSSEEKVALHDQLELVQQKDWKELTLDEKKAGAYMTFFRFLPPFSAKEEGVVVV
jgi:cytochrome c oxidase subunit 4